MAGLTDRILVVISASAGGAISEIDKLGKSTQAADTNAQKLSKTMKAGLVAGAAAFIGTGLVSFLNDSVSAYADAAKAAGDLAKATGGSVQNVSRMQAALKDAGISADQSAGMLTKFTTNAGKNKDLLKQLNVELKTGAGGAVDYADGMVQAVDAIMKIGDASERNRELVALFGKQGAQAFQDMIAAGVPLSEAMKAISENRVFTEEDRAKAQAYDDAMDTLNASMEGLQNTIGRTLVPILSEAATAFSAILEFMLQIPGPVYIAAGAMTAFALASKSALFGGIISEAKLLGTALLELGTAGAVAGTGLRAAGDGLVAMGKKIIGPASVLAAVALANSAFQEKGNAEEFARRTDIVTGSLEEQTAAYQKQDGVIASVLSGFRGLKGEQKEYAGYVYDSAKATLASATATEAQKKAAQDLVTVMDANLDGNKNHTAELHRQALTTDEAREAQKNYAASFGETAAAQQEAAAAALELSDMTLDLVTNGSAATTTWQDLALAAQAANTSTLEQKQATNLAEIAMGQFSVSIQGTIGWLDRLSTSLSAPEENLNTLQEVFANWKTDDPSTWGDEWVIGFEKSKQTLQGQIDLWASQGLTTDQIIVKIKELIPTIETAPSSVLTPEQKQTFLDYINNTLIPSLSGKGNEVPVPITASVDPNSKTTVKEDLDMIEGTATVNAETPATGPGSIGSVQAQIDNLLGTKTATVTVATTYSGEGGYSGEKARVDYLSQQRQGKIDITTAILPDSYNDWKMRADYLAQNRVGKIDISVNFLGGSYNDWKARVDYLSQNRTANIDVVVRGASSARATIEGLNAQASARQARFGRVQMPEITVPQPVNIVKVSVDGQQLDARIRDQLLQVRRSDDLVAAMGVVA